MPNENENTQETNENEAELEYSFNFNVPNVQPLDVTPSTEEQEIFAPDGISGYSPVNVGAVDATIDANITADNIREGIEILGVEGDLIELKGQEKTVNPTTSTQNITPDNNFNGLTKVTVNAVTSSIDSDIKSENILEGINILGVEGSVVELKGEEKIVNLSNKDGQTFTPTGENNGITSIHVNPKNKNVTIQPQTVSQTIGIDDGYSGNGNITVNAVTKTIDTNIQSYNIKQGVEVLGVQGSVVELEGEDKTVTLNNKEGQTFTPSNGKNGLTSLTVIPHNENRTINPSTEFKTVEINEGYSGNGTLAVMPVTNAIDQNIKPQNIKQGVKILGVNGALPTVVNNTELTVNPSTEEQVITPAGNYTGFDEVTVNPVTSAIDANITTSNIKDGVTILGVTGEVVELNADSLSVTPTTSVQTITPTSPINGFNEVNVSAVTSSIDNNITASNIKDGVTILGVTGEVVELNADSLSVTPTTSVQTITPTSPINGFNEVNVSAVTSSIDNNITASNIKDGVTILGVTGNFDPSPTIDSLNITPTTSAQTITATGGVDGYSPVNVSAVTSSIDSNITPNKIRNGVNILGVIGTYGEPLPPEVIISNGATWYIDTNGDLYGCGYNGSGNQGSGDTTNVTTFTKRAENVVQVACSGNTNNQSTTWYIDSNGDLYGCGRNEYGQQGSGNETDVLTFAKRAENVAQVACSNIATWYIDSNGDLYGCGSNYSGQQGNGTSGSYAYVATFTKRAENVSQVACSSSTTWYIDTNGDLYGCGGGSYGQQGSGNETDVTTFTKRGENVVQVACSQYTTWYIDSNGDLYGCGYNNYGQQGNGGSGTYSDVRTFTKRAENVVQIACSQYTTWYIDSNGDLYGCGYNGSGNQGSGNFVNVTTFTKRGENVTQFVCPSYHQNTDDSSWYIDTNGDLYGCGYNGSGNQGSGDTTNVTTFTKRAENVVQVACSQFDTCYVTSTGDIYISGSNYYGQTGSGTSGSGTNVLTFTKIN